MTKESLELANEISERINDLESLIESIKLENNEAGGRPAINWVFAYVNDKEDFKKSTLRYLRNKLAGLEKQFSEI